MRTYGEYAELQLWAGAPTTTATFRPEHLAVLRFELIQRGGVDCGWLDLTFANAGRTRVMPGVLVDLMMAARSDPSAFIWPRAVGAALDDHGAATLIDRCLPHVAALLRARVVPLEALVRLHDCAAFEAARAAGEAGATPLASLLARIAPWVYAARLAGNGPVACETHDAALGAAVLRRYGLGTTGTFAAAPAAWYDIAPAAPGRVPSVRVRDAAAAAGSALEVVLQAPPSDPGWHAVDVPEALPMDVTLTFDPWDGAIARRFWVRAPAHPSRKTANVPEPLGPGRIPHRSVTFVVREDLRRVPDADTDEIDELAAWARRAGAVTHVAGTNEIDRLAPDTVPVACGDVREPGFVTALEALARRGMPFVAWLQPLGAYSAWHEAALTRSVLAASDDRALTLSLRAYDRGGVALGDIPFDEPPASAAVSARLSTALGAAAAILLPATQSVERFQEAYGVVGRPLFPVLPVLPTDDHLDDPSVLCGDAPYVLVHAPAYARALTATAVLALRDTEIPLLVACARADEHELRTLRRLAGPRTAILSDPAAGIVHALYRNAAIFVDPALRPRGLGRLVRAARAGALPVVFADSPLAALVPSEAVVPERGVMPLRDTLHLLWSSPQRSNLARLARTSGRELERTPEAVAELLRLFADVAGG